MKKKITSLAICLSLILPGAAFAQEEITECWEETEEPKIAPAAEVQKEVTFGGKKIDIPEDFFSEADEIFLAGAQVKFAEAARLAGYSVEYDADTNTVVSKKDKRIVKIKLSGDFLLKASVSGEGKEEKNFLVYGMVQNGKLYVSAHELDKLLMINCIDNSVYDEEGNLTLIKLDIYEIEPLKKKVIEKIATIKKLANIGEEGGINSVKTDCEIDMSFVSENYGIRLNGNSKIGIEQSNFEGKSYYKISADFTGIHKMFIALLAMNGYGAAHGPSAENEDFNIVKAIFEDPIEAEIYVSGGDLYVKSGVLAKLDILPAEAKDAFILYKGAALADGMPGNSGAFKITDEQYDEIAQWLSVMALDIFENYDGAEKFIDAMLKLYDENHIKVTEKGGSATVEIKIGQEDIGAVFDIIFSAAEAQNEEITKSAAWKGLKSLKMSAEGKDEYKNGTYKGSSTVTALMDIPSAVFDEPVGTFKTECKVTSTGEKKNENIKLPEKFKLPEISTAID